MKYVLLSLAVCVPMLVRAQTAPAKKPKNIILLVGDGMGTAQIFAGLTANKGTLNLGRCTAIGFQKTQAADEFVTDSGAGATAFAIGRKAKNGAIGVDADEKSHETILETAHKAGQSTGIVVTCSITHATPASFFAHVPKRSQVEDIAAQLVSGNSVDMFVGGGKDHFVKRKDGRNLASELAAKGYRVVDSTADLSGYTSGKLAMFTADVEPRRLLDGRGDILLRGVQAGLRMLPKNPNGFFLLIEGSQIDWGGHANNTNYITSEMLDFDKTVGAVLDFAERDGNTLVVVTADHETGGLAVMDGDMGLGRVQGKYTTGGHTGVMVPVFAYGPGAEAFIGIYENTAIYSKLIAASGLIVK